MSDLSTAEDAVTNAQAALEKAQREAAEAREADARARLKPDELAMADRLDMTAAEYDFWNSDPDLDAIERWENR